MRGVRRRREDRRVRIEGEHRSLKELSKLEANSEHRRQDELPGQAGVRCKGCAARGQEGEVRKRASKFEGALEARSGLRSSRRSANRAEQDREERVEARGCRGDVTKA